MYVTTGTCFYCIIVLLNSARTRRRFTKKKKILQRFTRKNFKFHLCLADKLKNEVKIFTRVHKQEYATVGLV